MEIKEPETFQQDFEKVSRAVNALKQERCLTGIILEECEKNLAYFNNYLEGSYKFTFLLDGEAQTGKTTLLNCLLGDDIITGLKGNYIIIVQYDASYHEPELFISELQDIYNSEKEVFIVSHENLKKTGSKGRIQIQNDLRELIPQSTPEDDSDAEAQKQVDQIVFIIKYKIDWLKDGIKDDFILNRIQFLDINKSNATRAEFENIIRFQSITSSKDHSQIYVADSQKLFSDSVSQKFQEFKKKEDRSLLVINRTDNLGTNAHFKKIDKNKSALTSKLNVNFEDLSKKIEDREETDHDRREIFYQAFMEGQEIQQGDIDPRDILFFTSSLYNINRLLIYRYQLTPDSKDRELDALNDLFIERNKNSQIFRNNKRRAAQKEIHVLKYYIQSPAGDEYERENSISYIQKAITDICKAKFAKLENEFPLKLNEVKDKISNPDYLSKKLSEGEVQELRDFMEREMKPVFEEREQRILAIIHVFYHGIIQQTIQEFNIAVRKINPQNPDFFAIKNSHEKELNIVFADFKKNWKIAEAQFVKELEETDSKYYQEIKRLKTATGSKKHILNYLNNNLELHHNKIKRVYSKTSEAITQITKGTFVKITDFVTGSNLLRQISFFISQLFGKTDHQCLDFPCVLKCSTEKFYSSCHEMKSGYENYLNQQKEELNKDFEDYLQNAPGFTIEKAQQVIQEYL